MRRTQFLSRTDIPRRDKRSPPLTNVRPPPLPAPAAVRSALSFGAVIRADGSFDLGQLTITPSLVAAERLTYNEVRPEP